MSARVWRVVALVAVTWFLVQVVTGLVLPMGGRLADTALLLRPLDGEARLTAARLKLSRSQGEWNVAQLRAVLKQLDVAAELNPLNYRAQFDRARVLLRLEAMGEGTTDAAYEAMRKTLWLRWKDPEVGIEGMRFALSRWPLLSPDEQAFYRDLFSRMVAVVRKNEFKRILDIWKRYSRDLTLLKAGLVNRPQFGMQAAQALAKMQVHLAERQQFMTLYEAWALDYYKQLLKTRTREERNNYDTWKRLVRYLSNAVKGYFRLAPESGFDQSAYTRFMDNLQMRQVVALTGTMEWSRRVSARKEIMKLATAMVERPAAEATLKELVQRLERTRFFAEFQSDPAVLDMRMRLLLQAGEASAAALVGVDVVRKRHYVPPDETDAVRNLFSLYAEALERMGRVDEALSVIAIARERTGGHASLDWMAFRLQNPAEGDPASPAWQALSPEVRDSYRVALAKKNIKRTVYPPPHKELMVEVTAASEAMLSEANLVQVWANGKILAERYVKDLEAGEEWRIKLFEDLWDRPVEVEVITK